MNITLTNLSSKENLGIIPKRIIGKIIVAHLNIISLRNKLNSLISQITGSIGILMISEKKTRGELSDRSVYC